MGLKCEQELQDEVLMRFPPHCPSYKQKAAGSRGITYRKDTNVQAGSRQESAQHEADNREQ